MAIAISIEDLSKLYRLGQVGTGTISHDLNRWWAALRGKEDPYAQVGIENDRSARLANKKGQEYVWALQQIDLEVYEGEIIGIIGRNGAGKSTLLKLLSRVTSPTKGLIRTKGRIASLLEVGTGFHPELTGRENVYLNGAILGMKRGEISNQLDAIVEFSGCGKYLDTPVKRYSSGMQVRLGFAVAAHLSCEILIVDEVLAVGDAEFQRKCIGRMKDVSESGRTVLFVSHNMHAVNDFCTRSVILDKGRIDFIGNTNEAIGRYLAAGVSREASVSLAERETDREENYVRLLALSLFQNNQCTNTVEMGNDLTAEITLECSHPMESADIGIKISSMLGIPIHYFVSTWEGLSPDLSPGTYRFQMRIPRVMLFPGQYQLGAWVSQRGARADSLHMPAMKLNVVKSDITGHGNYMEKYVTQGCEVYCPSVWTELT